MRVCSHFSGITEFQSVCQMVPILLGLWSMFFWSIITLTETAGKQADHLTCQSESVKKKKNKDIITAISR